jgi:hypothetical protein
MALDFPNSPTTGQVFPSPPISGTPVWQWNGSQWVIVPSVAGLIPGQIPGTTTNDNAAAGNVGEYITASASSVALVSSGGNVNVCSINITPGDWDVSALGYLVGGPLQVQVVQSGLSTTSATFNTAVGLWNSFVGPFVQYYNVACPIPPYRFSVAVNTTIYLVMQVTWNGGVSGTVSGRIQARRVR